MQAWERSRCTSAWRFIFDLFVIVVPQVWHRYFKGPPSSTRAIIDSSNAFRSIMRHESYRVSRLRNHCGRYLWMQHTYSPSPSPAPSLSLQRKRESSIKFKPKKYQNVTSTTCPIDICSQQMVSWIKLKMIFVAKLLVTLGPLHPFGQGWFKVIQLNDKKATNWALDQGKSLFVAFVTSTLIHFMLLPRETWLGPYASGNSELRENSWSWTASGKQCKCGKGPGAPQHDALSLFCPSLSFHKFDTDTSVAHHLLLVLSLTPATHSSL